MKSAFQKRLCLFLSFVILTGALFFSVSFLYPSFRLRQIGRDIFREEMEHDTLSLHYVLANPKNGGISPALASLPVYSRREQRRADEKELAYLHQLEKIPAQRLRGDTKLLYILLKDYYKMQTALNPYLYYNEPLSPSSGMHSQLPLLLSEYTFREKQDVLNYLSLLEQLPACFDGLLIFEQEKAKEGLFMPDSSVDKVIAQCQQIADRHLLSSKTHFLETTFSKRLQPLLASGSITPAEADGYTAQNHALLSESILPAYEKLETSLAALKGSCHNEKGLCHFPDGRAYYRLLLAQTTGSSRSVPALKKMLLKQLKSDTAALSELLVQNPGLYGSDLLPTAFPTKEPAEMLQQLQSRSLADFPALPLKKHQSVSCSVKNVSENLEDYCAPAFYLTAPIDDISENVIYLNQKNSPDGLSLYTTLAHEGYPGHLYQTVYYHLYCRENSLPPIRALLSCGGYVEGWAYYVEMRSYAYAKELAVKNGGKKEEAAVYEAQRLNRSIQLCLYSLLDIAIHYEGISPQQAQKVLAAFGIRDADTAHAIYEYIREEPAVYPKYYVGYLELLALKNTLQEQWGEGYSDKRFHQAVLNAGPAPFSVLTKYTLSSY